MKNKIKSDHQTYNSDSFLSLALATLNEDISLPLELRRLHFIPLVKVKNCKKTLLISRRLYFLFPPV